MKRKLIDSVCNKSKVQDLEVGDKLKVFKLSEDHAGRHAETVNKVIDERESNYLIYRVIKTCEKVYKMNAAKSEAKLRYEDGYGYSRRFVTEIKDSDEWKLIES